MKTIAPAELHHLLASQPDLLLVDVRTPGEYISEHVWKSHNAPLDSLAPRALAESGFLPKAQPVYLFCQTGGRATRAAELFTQDGLEAVVVEGGLIGWKDAGLPVIQSAGGAISLERQVRIAAGSLVLLGVLLGWFVHPYFVGLSAFVGAGLVFAGITDFCGMGLLLAKLPWNSRAP